MQNKTNDRIYRNDLARNGIDTSDIKGFIDNNTYGNLIRSQQIRDNAEWRKLQNETMQDLRNREFEYRKRQDAIENAQNWEKIKMTEGRTSVLSGVPNSLPAMVKAVRMQEKARGIGFDWDNADQVKDKVLEEYAELQEELAKEDNHDKIEAEFGDFLFAIINWSRFIGVNPEDALERTNKKFKNRFQYMEKKSREEGRLLSDMTLAEMDVWWNEAKKLLND
jgi:MazG family protein